MADEKAKNESAGGCIALVILCALIGPLVYNFYWGEQEGIVKTDDCRTTVWVKEGSSDTWFKRFTCTYTHDNSGKVTGGTCEHPEVNNGVCETVYVYTKQKP